MEQNNLDSLKQRLSFKKIALESIVSGLGSPDEITLHYFNRNITVLFEEPGIHKEITEAIVSYLEKEVSKFEVLVSDGEVLAQEFAAAKLIEQQITAERLAQEETNRLANEKAQQTAQLQAETDRKEYEAKIKAEQLKQEQLKTKILEAELAAKIV